MLNYLDHNFFMTMFIITLILSLCAFPKHKNIKNLSMEEKSNILNVYIMKFSAIILFLIFTTGFFLKKIFIN